MTPSPDSRGGRRRRPRQASRRARPASRALSPGRARAPHRRQARAFVERCHLHDRFADRRQAHRAGAARHRRRYRRAAAAAARSGFPCVAGLERRQAPRPCCMPSPIASRRAPTKSRCSNAGTRARRTASCRRQRCAAPRTSASSRTAPARRAMASGCRRESTGQLHDAVSDRAGRRHHAVEHALHAVDLEDRAGARGGLHGRAQAGRVEPDHGAAARGDRARSGPARGCAQRRARTRRGSGQGAHRCIPTIKAIAFVGESATGSAIMGQGARDPEARALRARRQECRHRLCGCRSRARARCGGVHDLQPERRALHVVEPPARSRNRSPGTSSRAWRSGCKRLRVGHPLDPATEVGPLIHPRHKDKILSYFEIARREGATIAVGGTASDGPGGGHYVSPTLFTGARPDMKIAQDEIFGPVLTALTFRDEAEAIALANGVPLRTRGVSVDARPRARAARRGAVRGRHAVDQLGERAPSADALRRRQGERHRARWRRLLVRFLHGNEERRDRGRHAQRSRSSAPAERRQ